MSTLHCAEHFSFQKAQGTKYTSFYKSHWEREEAIIYSRARETQLRNLGDCERTPIRTLAQKSKMFINNSVKFILIKTVCAICIYI